MFYNQTSLKGFSTFSTISLAFSIVSIIPALLKPFIAISFSSLRVLYRSTIHFACGGFITESLRETLTSAAAFPALNCFDISLASQANDYDYSGVNDEESSAEGEAAIIIETDLSKPASHTPADQSKLVSYTDSSSEEEEDLHVDVNFDEPVDLTIN